MGQIVTGEQLGFTENTWLQLSCKINSTHKYRKTSQTCWVRQGSLSLNVLWSRPQSLQILQKLGQKATGTCHGGKHTSPWWTPAIRAAVKLKKDDFQAILHTVSPETAERYWHARRAVGQSHTEMKAKCMELVWRCYGKQFYSSGEGSHFLSSRRKALRKSAAW